MQVCLCPSNDFAPFISPVPSQRAEMNSGCPWPINSYKVYIFTQMRGIKLSCEQLCQWLALHCCPTFILITMSASALGCAQNPDGSLKDVSQVVFIHDVDDEHPISGPQSSTPRPLAPIFAPKVKPLGKVAGSRRSSRSPRCSRRASRPSALLMDPDNAEVPKPATATAAVKRIPVGR
jgi:hypothetical protein